MQIAPQAGQGNADASALFSSATELVSEKSSLVG
jgi:hypothetical protein